MDVEKTIGQIQFALKEVDVFISNSNYYTNEKEPIVNVRKVLSLLLKEMLISPENINESVLRGAINIGIYSFKYFENTSLGDLLSNIDETLYKEIPKYKTLQPLGNDISILDLL